ncbi:Fic family protein, partial [Candidatus Dependentiae bacterium]|nr:Fic family protein [Candidatus Dependentiae bacterium]
MENLLNLIKEKKIELDSYRPLPIELVQNLDHWFKIESTYNSNAIEGNTLTKKETTLVIEKGITIGGKSLKEHLEAINLSFAFDYIKSFSKKKYSDISLKDILHLHYLVLKKIDDKNAGKFRKIAV